MCYWGRRPLTARASNANIIQVKGDVTTPEWDLGVSDRGAFERDQTILGRLAGSTPASGPRLLCQQQD